MTSRCSICGAKEGERHRDDRHRAFEAMKNDACASEPLSFVRAVREGDDPETRKNRARQSPGKRR
jgi:hypothetical protein